MNYELNKSNLKSISWESNTLTVYYLSGMIVEYSEVQEGVAAGMANAKSPGSFMRLYVSGNYSYNVIKTGDMVEEHKNLIHHKDTVEGLWATDRPDMIPGELKHLFFQIEYNAHF